MAKWVYKFSEGNASMRNLLGGKGANLAEMTGLGMPIPQGFTVTTEACTDYYASNRKIRDEIVNQIFDAVSWLEEINGKKFGDTQEPLLVSVSADRLLRFREGSFACHIALFYLLKSKDWSQSFQTGSRPNFFRSRSTSTAFRSSLTWNCSSVCG